MSNTETKPPIYAFYGMSLLQFFDSLRYQRSVILAIRPKEEQKIFLLSKLGVGTSLQGATVEWIHTLLHETHNTWEWQFGLYDPNAVFGTHRLRGYYDGSKAEGLITPSEK
ncbi:MAG: hypothetical protein WC565_02240 [Parcubacteria group bacterium]